MKRHLYILTVFCAAVFAGAASSAPVDSTAGNGRDKVPVMLGILSPNSAFDLASALDSANQALLKQKVAEIKALLEDARPQNTRLKKELAAWEAALKQWKRGDPVNAGVATVVIAEEPTFYCVAYFPERDESFICFLDKKTYMQLPEDKQRKAIHFNQTTRVLF